eukprot:scaffold549_cov385-Prasinococcus_capsulatus_cf.AAC.17
MRSEEGRKAPLPRWTAGRGPRVRAARITGGVASPPSARHARGPAAAQYLGAGGPGAAQQQQHLAPRALADGSALALEVRTMLR